MPSLAWDHLIALLSNIASIWKCSPQVPATLAKKKQNALKQFQCMSTKEREKLIPQSFKMITLTFIFTHSVLHSFIFYMHFLLHSGSQESAGADPSCQVPRILTLNNNIDDNIIMFWVFLNKEMHISLIIFQTSHLCHEGH